jgi:hypothetical protein
MVSGSLLTLTVMQSGLERAMIILFERSPGILLLTMATSAALFALRAPEARAAERIYEILTNESSIAISGTVTSATLGTATIAEQGPGSLVTSYSGTIRTDRGPGTIQFLGGSAVDANVSGSWQPLADGSAGTASADYGGRAQFNIFATLYFAARNVVADLTSGAMPVTNGDFDQSTTTMTFAQGSIGYRDSPFGATAGMRSLVGESGTLSGTGLLTTEMQPGELLETLTIPINSSVSIPAGDGFVNLTLTGQLVAAAPILLGDYNEDGSVDAADYVIWRKGLGTLFTQADYDVWSANYGQTAGSGGSAISITGAVRQSSAAPEPSGIVLLIASSFFYGAVRRRGPITHYSPCAAAGDS